MKDKKIITEYFDGVIRSEKTTEVFSSNLPLLKSGLKLSLAATFSFLLLLSVSSIGGTVSYFNDTEGVFNNYFRADPISFKVETAMDQIDLSEDGKIDLVMTPDEISDPIQYFITSKVLAGDGEFCSGINVIGTLPFNISNRIDSLNTDISTTTGTWTITASVADGLKVPGKSCQVELTYLGWNAGSILGKSFTDMRKVNLLFFIPSTYKSSIPTEPVPSTNNIDTQSVTTEVIVPTPEPTVVVDEKSASSTIDETVIQTVTVSPEVTPTPEASVDPAPTVSPIPTDIPLEIVDTAPSQS